MILVFTKWRIRPRLKPALGADTGSGSNFGRFPVPVLGPVLRLVLRPIPYSFQNFEPVVWVP